MSYSPINAYLSNLDTLVFDSPSETIHTDKDINEELDLWVIANIFSFFSWGKMMTAKRLIY